MQIRTINSRGTLFTFKNAEWDLNIYFIKGRRYNYIIDTGFGTDSIKPIMEYMNDITKETIVINTHYHWDHIWGNAALKDCLLISHKLCREQIITNWEGMLVKNSRYCCGEVKMHLPDLVFEDELYFAEDRVKLFHSPGHTPDSISIIDEEDSVLILGDNIGDDMEDIIPSIECDRNVYIDTLKKYLKLDFDTFISGHNSVLTKETLETVLHRMQTDI
jgi:glyoxylase-like metal-dependent hydrolase (beta-lactamase superfamily II)